MSFIEASHVDLVYLGNSQDRRDGGTLALAGIELAIEEGSFVSIVGPSGCGKSTLLRLLCGLMPPSRGTVRVDGRQVDAPLKTVGIAFQNSTLLPWRTIRENVLLPLEIVAPHRARFRKNKSVYVARTEKLLATVGLDGLGDRMPWELSGGMQQRAQLCRALIHEPAILLLDEPFAALDPFTREELWGVLQTLFTDRHCTVILVTHELREAVFLSDIVHIMSARSGPGDCKQIDRAHPSAPTRDDLPQWFRWSRPGIAQSHRQREGSVSERLLERLAPWATAAAVVGLWWLGVDLLKIEDYVLPSPYETATAIYTYRLPLLASAAATLATTLTGFAVAVVIGAILGIAIGSFRLLHSAFYPLLVAFNSLPKAALVPILVIWFGVGPLPAVITAFVLSFFPIVVNVATGFATVEPELVDVLRALGATRLDRIRKVGLPRSLPYFFASLKIAITLSFVGSVIAEIIAGDRGIGHVMLIAGSDFNVPLVFGALLVVGAMGTLMYVVFAALERRFTGWSVRAVDHPIGR